jgi:hypothetical protein
LVLSVLVALHGAAAPVKLPAVDYRAHQIVHHAKKLPLTSELGALLQPLQFVTTTSDHSVTSDYQCQQDWLVIMTSTQWHGGTCAWLALEAWLTMPLLVSCPDYQPLVILQ